MASSTFHFKQFTIHQDQCAMKVSTDGILLGSWADAPTQGNALDIGTGTGLLALMLAQRFPNLGLHAIEIDQPAFQQAKANVKASPWTQKIELFEGAVQNFSSAFAYDFVICNPPYFPVYQRSEEKTSRNTARQQGELNLRELLLHVNRLLRPHGRFALILPTETLAEIEQLALTFSLFIRKKTAVRYMRGKRVSRYLLELGKEEVPLAKGEMCIQKPGTLQYTEEFIRLSRNFYAFMT